MSVTAGGFFAELPAFRGFEGVLDDASYRPVPDAWSLGVADVEGSTAAIGEGRYKDVNLAGAAVICAVANAVGDQGLPFAFGGDGAVLALSAEDAGRAEPALGRVRRWVREELGLGLRAGLVPVTAVRAAGRDVRLARHGVGEVAYAMFSGGGARWAEERLKAGEYGVPEAPPGGAPDLSGLSCRWTPVRSRNGVVLSLIVEPAAQADPAAFRALVGELLEILRHEDAEGHPLPSTAPPVAWPPQGLELERRARNPGSRRGRARILFEAGVARASDALARPVGGFDARLHRADVAHNSDFRKFDDGLKLTVDVTPAAADRLEALLAEGAARGVCRCGAHRQDEALLTCIIPSFREREHVHFIDGAAGGYALAAAAMKRA